mgnify:CR=1 FL=1
MKMNVRFYVEKRRGPDGRLLTTDRPIFMAVTFNGKRVLTATGRKVHLSGWDHDKQQVRDTIEDAFMINSWLQALRQTAETAWKAMSGRAEKPGAEGFRREFEKHKPRFSGGFFDVMFLFMKEGSERWSSNSYKKVRSFYGQLRDFEKETGHPVAFHTMDQAFLNRFREYNRHKNRSDMTILKMVNTLVWFLNWATEKGYNVYDEYRLFYRQLGKPEKPDAAAPVYLDWNELIELRDHKIDMPRKERVRDLFCLMCFTGLRYSEISRLTKDDIGTGALVIRKSGKMVREVPLNEHAVTLLAKYQNRYYPDQAALPPVSPGTMNKYLVILGKELGLNRSVTDPKNSTATVPLHDAMTAGVGVQTFIMNAMRLGIPAELITAFTGVSSDQRVKLLQQEMAKKQIMKFDKI